MLWLIYPERLLPSMKFRLKPSEQYLWRRLFCPWHRLFCWINAYVLKTKDQDQEGMLTVAASSYPQVHCSIFPFFLYRIFKNHCCKEQQLNRFHQLHQQKKMVIKEHLSPFCWGSHITFINIVTTWLHPSNQVLFFHLTSLIHQPLKSVESHH